MVGLELDSDPTGVILYPMAFSDGMSPGDRVSVHGGPFRLTNLCFGEHALDSGYSDRNPGDLTLRRAVVQSYET